MEEQKDLEQQEQTAEPAQEDAQAKTQQSDESGLPKTQQELDELIERRIARERKKLAKQNGTQQRTAQQSGEAQAAADAAMKSLNTELIAAKAQLEAYKSGVSAEAAEDAVLLALHQIEKDGDEPDADTIREALKAVLKRHPEWKKEEKKGGIKVGAQEGQTEESKKKPYGGVTFF